MRRSDFTTDHASVPGDPPALPNAWPIDYDAFRPYYAAAEAALRVAGERDPLDPDDDSQLAEPPSLSARDTALCDMMTTAGLSPFRLHVGFDYLPGCTECPGYRCARGCKADADSRALHAARATGRVRLQPGVSIHSIRRVAEGFEVAAAPGAQRWRAARVVMAAGALNTPLILARSRELWGDAGPPAMLGRGLMFHSSDAFAVRLPWGLDTTGPRRSLAFRDFYNLGARSFGEIQSFVPALQTATVMSRLRALAQPLGRAAPLVEAARPLAWAIARLLGPIPVLTTILEDMPYPENRVTEGPRAPGVTSGRIEIRYHSPRDLLRRTHLLRRMLRRAFGAHRLIFLTEPGQPNFGHPMGTCRMGTDPATSVVAPDGQAHGQPGLYVADASVFPSSGGTGPSLTVAALALRLGDHIAGRVAAHPEADVSRAKHSGAGPTLTAALTAPPAATP